MPINRRIFYALFALAFSAAALSLLPACSKRPAAGPSAAMTTHYHCPMHPRYVSDKPGDCAICGMRLVPDSTEMPALADPMKTHRIVNYRNPMNPAITSPVPAKDNMGMDYIPVYEDDMSAPTSVPGQSPVQLSGAGSQAIGVKLATVEHRELETLVRASAKVAYDPGLYSAVLEHQEAVRTLQSTAGDSAFHSEADSTVRASTLRLRQMGLSPSQIKRITQPGFDAGNLLLAQPGGSVWIYAELYDYESSLVKPGQMAELTSPAFPGRVLMSTVRSLDTVMNGQSRTLRARLEAANPDGVLKPEMYVSATIHADLGRVLAAPHSAIIDTGTRQLAYVQTAPGAFEPRTVTIGRQGDGYDEVLAGLREGESVAISANFLIDSESKLRGAAQ